MLFRSPMDRLVCGDVGFGKTEVAMRAAFIAVHGGRQVAILVPTTLLAQQHYNSFRDRFADWPVRVEVMSRFKSTKEINAAVADLAEGKIDIVIGTHKLLQDDVKIKNLGLVIIDEEHRFGVRQKEQLKALRSEVDILTLTATPIPRTLNMAVSGMRDLSIIATPPARRLSVRTFVIVFTTSPGSAEIENALEKLPEHLQRIKHAAHGYGRQVRTLINPLVICRDSDAEAWEVHAAITSSSDSFLAIQALEKNLVRNGHAYDAVSIIPVPASPWLAQPGAFVFAARGKC